MPTTSDITALLLDLRAGDGRAKEALYPFVYDTLREIARQRVRSFRPGDTLNATALVHEVYLKLIDQTRAGWQGRAHFFATASRAMRFVLIDYARARTAARRGGRQPDFHLGAADLAADERAADLLALDEALETLAQCDPRLNQLVELRFFAGMSYEEIAEVTGLSAVTAKRDWQRARAWLCAFMQDVPHTGATDD
jgi:RNA polymerase sigma factor (TIGR02999 family)